jgi:predicted site-specific integrase-resolvase
MEKHAKHLFDDRGLLIGWQQTADYLGISVSTAKRWKKHYGLPLLWQASGRRMISSMDLSMQGIKTR